MPGPENREFCPHCGIALDGEGSCRDCNPDTEPDRIARLQRRHLLSRAEADDRRDRRDPPSPPRDPGGCLPVTPPLALATGPAWRRDS